MSPKLANMAVNKMTEERGKEREEQIDEARLKNSRARKRFIVYVFGL